MKIGHLIIYLVIGGALAGLVDKSHVEDCDRHIGSEELTKAIVLWPAIITLSMITIKTSEIKSGKDDVYCIKEQS